MAGGLLNNAKTMKPLMILGALIGFGIGILFGLAEHGAWPSALWRASAAALIASVLMRWWGRVWLQNLRAAQQQQLTDFVDARRKESQKN